MKEIAPYSRKAALLTLILVVLIVGVLAVALAMADTFDAIYIAVFLIIAIVCTRLFDPLRNLFSYEGATGRPGRLGLRGNIYFVTFFFGFVMGRLLLRAAFGLHTGKPTFRHIWLVTSAVSLMQLPYLVRYYWRYFTRNDTPGKDDGCTDSSTEIH